MSQSKGKSNKTVFHLGDTVKIISPKLIKRVGYPLVFTDLISEFENHTKLTEAMTLLGLCNEHETVNPRSKLARDFIVGCAKAATRHRGFGGNERSIYYYDESENQCLVGCEVIVTSKRTVKTGTYYPPFSGYSYEGEYDYEPGGLSNEKTHILLSFFGGEIEDVNVQLVKKSEERGG